MAKFLKLVQTMVVETVSLVPNGTPIGPVDISDDDLEELKASLIAQIAREGGTLNDFSLSVAEVIEV